ncbi:MAG TPA: aquaporin [Chloroflexota bacterium]|nr:aquaporin [Chloroflexota bacterium]
MKAIAHELTAPATWRAVLAEVVGTFFLALAAFISGGPYAVGLTLVIMVYVLGRVSGASLNPAATVGLVVARHLSVLRGGLYIVAEVAGALLARLLAQYVTPLPLQFTAANTLGELLGVGFLIVAVLAVTGGYVPQAASGLTIGGGLLAGLLTSKGILNPAIAFAMGQTTSAPWALWAPIAGALLFAGIFRVLASFQVAVPAAQGTEATPQPAETAA